MQLYSDTESKTNRVHRCASNEFPQLELILGQCHVFPRGTSNLFCAEFVKLEYLTQAIKG